MVNKIDIKPATLISGSSVSVQVLKYVDGSLSEDNTYTFDANDFESLASSSNPYVAILTFGTVHTENINGSTTQCFFDGTVCSPNDAYTLAGLVEVDVTAYASGGGGYTFPSNSGNTAYVSSGGNDGTGVVGNISKPFLTADGAIAALNNAVDGALIIISSTSTIDITDYDYTTMPYNLKVSNLCLSSIRFAGSCSFGNLGLHTNGDLIVNTQLLCTADDMFNIECRVLHVPNTSQGTLGYVGAIKCDMLLVEANINIDITADVLIWNRSASVGAIIGFTYNYCPPKVWKARLSQSSTNPPSIDFVYKNTYGETMSASYVGTGEYDIESAGNNFVVDKTQVYFGTSDYDLVVQYSSMNKGLGTDGTVNIHSFDAFLSISDGMIKSLDITIETYL
jgi:hypothetical protein